MIDLRDDIRQAISDPTVARVFAEFMAPIIDAAVDRAMARAAADRLLTYRESATFVGLKYEAFRSRVYAEPELAALAIGSGLSKRFRKTDLERYMETRRPRPRTRAASAATATASTPLLES